MQTHLSTRSFGCRRLRPAGRALVAAVLLGVLDLCGCASITNPVSDGVPVRQLAPEFLKQGTENYQSIPLTSLRQKPPEFYRLEANDVLGVYIEGVLGERNVPPPVRYAEQNALLSNLNLPPAVGYPVPVREDGTIPLPLIEPINVKGMTIAEAQNAIRDAYTVKKKILQPGRERIIVTLMYPRQYRVLVVRQDSGAGTGTTQPVSFGSFVGATEIPGPRKRGAGYALNLPAYENDLLNALVRTGGLPGLDAKNEVIIQRSAAQAKAAPEDLLQQFQHCRPGSGAGAAADANVQTIRIPLRLPPGEQPSFRPEDIILQTGDIVSIESRDTEVFYTGGLLLSGQYPLPRDYDLDVVQAIALVRGPLINGATNQNNFTGQTQTQGIGFPNPSLVSILRQLPNGCQVTIRVDLNRALRDPRERVLIQPKDIIILQNTLGEAVGQYFTSVFKLDWVGTIIRQRDLITTATLNVP
jgi:protein involved in polysaccharide export with SLBB domain